MFRFTIRDVLWLTVVVALAIAWGVERWHLRQAVQHQNWQLGKLIAHFRDVEGATVQHSPEGIFVVETGWDDGQSYWYPVKPETTYPPDELIEAALKPKAKSALPRAKP
jgi:hypothetical protein